MSTDDTPPIPERPWGTSVEEVCSALRCDPETGLTQEEAARRLRQYGPNRLREHKARSAWAILADQFKSVIVLLLALAAAVSLAFGDMPETWAILAVILINAMIGFFTELRAVRSMEALHKLGSVTTRVKRGGEVLEVDASELVPGDLVLLEGGDVLTADMRLVEASKLQSDESALTGESLPVGKRTEAVPPETVLAERSPMLYKGTAVTRGSGAGVVTSTGEHTELGRISLMMEGEEDEETPLEQRLDKLGYRLIGVTLVIALFVILSGIWTGKELYLMIETGIALAVATIPEGLPIVATLALARGLRVMARKNALVNRLSSVETLGATGLICTDKTGTLTENRMTVTGFFLPGREITVEGGDRPFRTGGESLSPDEDNGLRLALETGMLCNNAALMEEGPAGTGEPLEVALLEAGRKAGMELKALRRRMPEEREEAFDPEVKMMATWNRLEGNGCRIHVKGAPDAVLEVCESERYEGEDRPLDESRKQKWLELNGKLAEKGLRLLALAVREAPDSSGTPYEGLTLTGLVAMQDPPREEVRPALEACAGAGIRVVMVTGDQPETARFIGAAVGLGGEESLSVMHGRDLPGPDELASSPERAREIEETSIFARISPRQKLDLIDFYRERGHIVAMTGDGVNDAPALKKADIGIAMGQRGTQVAREAADMVLTDDAFSTIVLAIRQGRVIFNNIRRFIYYLMSCNLSEILIVGIASLLGTVLPILPLQILFLNLVTDVFPALALGVGEGEKGIMKKPPRDPKESILGRKQWTGIAGYGLILTAAVLGALYISLEILELDEQGAVTVSFLTLASAQLWHVFNMGDPERSPFQSSVARNRWVWGAIALCVVLILLAVYLPPLASVLSVRPPGLNGWITVAGMSLAPLALVQIYRLARYGVGRGRS